MRAVVRREEPDQNDPNFRRALIEEVYRQEREEYEEWRIERRNLLFMKIALGTAVVIGLVILLYA